MTTQLFHLQVHVHISLGLSVFDLWAAVQITYIYNLYSHYKPAPTDTLI
jgi:hypothetical protein